jgi:hypothetical protein
MVPIQALWAKGMQEGTEINLIFGTRYESESALKYYDAYKENYITLIICIYWLE